MLLCSGRLRLVVAVLVSLTLVAPSSGATPGMATAAKQQFERGLTLYDTQQYDAAIEAFKAAYLADARPPILYALGQAYRKKGDCVQAVDAYRAFLRSNPPARQVEVVEKQIRGCEAQPAKLPAPEATSSTPALVPTSTAPVLAIVTPSSSSAAAPLGPTRRAFYTDVLGDALVLGGVAALSVAVVAYLGEQGERRAMDRAQSYADYGSGYDRATRDRTISLVAGGVGAALLAFGAIRFLTLPGGVEVRVDARQASVLWARPF